MAYIKAHKQHTFSDGTLRLTVEGADGKALTGVQFFGPGKNDIGMVRLSHAPRALVQVPPGSGRVYLHFPTITMDESPNSPGGDFTNHRFDFPLAEFLPAYRAGSGRSAPKN